MSGAGEGREGGARPSADEDRLAARLVDLSLVDLETLEGGAGGGGGTPPSGSGSGSGDDFSLRRVLVADLEDALAATDRKVSELLVLEGITRQERARRLRLAARLELLAVEVAEKLAAARG